MDARTVFVTSGVELTLMAVWVPKYVLAAPTSARLSVRPSVSPATVMHGVVVNFQFWGDFY